MPNVIYKQGKSEYQPTIDSNYLGKYYRDYATYLTKVIDELHDRKDRINDLTKIAEDNADPLFSLETLLCAFSKHLADVVTYGIEYENEYKNVDNNND
jgi:hypothetical protein